MIETQQNLHHAISDLPQPTKDDVVFHCSGFFHRSSFLLHAKRAGDKYGVASSDILVELGKMKTIGGQEDMIEDVALNLREAARAEARQ